MEKRSAFSRCGGLCYPIQKPWNGLFQLDPPLWLRRATPKWLRNIGRPFFYRLQRKIQYSRDFYENEYHRGVYRLHERKYTEVMGEWEALGWRAKLFRALDSIEVPLEPKNWLEAACHHGKTAFWLAEKFTETKFYMFDFSATAVEFCRRNNPIADRSEIWLGDVTRIENKGKRFERFFDVVTLLDVTEHLPHSMYLKAISEVFRVLRPGGYVLLKQGHEILPEHINVLSEEELVSDFRCGGFQLVQRLPERHYLLIKPSH